MNDNELQIQRYGETLLPIKNAFSQTGKALGVDLVKVVADD